MKRRTKILLALAVLLLTAGLSSCFVLGGIDDYGVIVVDNQSNETIYYLYVSHTNAMSWGEDVLGDDIINPGEAYYLTVSSGYYDVMVANFFNVEMDKIYDQLVIPGETTVITYY